MSRNGCESLIIDREWDKGPQAVLVTAARVMEDRVMEDRAAAMELGAPI